MRRSNDQYRKPSASATRLRRRNDWLAQLETKQDQLTPDARGRGWHAFVVYRLGCDECARTGGASRPYARARDAARHDQPVVEPDLHRVLLCLVHQ